MRNAPALRQWQAERLRHVRNRLLALVTPISPCGVAPEHKDAVRVYVESWVLPHIEVLMGNVARNGLDDLGDDDSSVNPENWARAYASCRPSGDGATGTP
jgi:hypothetical protein